MRDSGEAVGSRHVGLLVCILGEAVECGQVWGVCMLAFLENHFGCI